MLSEPKSRQKSRAHIRKRVIFKDPSHLMVNSESYCSLSNVPNIMTAVGFVTSKRLDRSGWRGIKLDIKVKRLDFEEKINSEFGKKDSPRWVLI